MWVIPLGEEGTSDMVTAAVIVVVAGVSSGSKVIVDSAGHDLGAAGLEEVDLLLAAVVAAGVLAAAAVGLAAVVAAPLQVSVGIQVGPEDPDDFGDQIPAAAVVEAAAGEEHKLAALAETVGAGCRGADLEQRHG